MATMQQARDALLGALEQLEAAEARHVELGHDAESLDVQLVTTYCLGFERKDGGTITTPGWAGTPGASYVHIGLLRHAVVALEADITAGSWDGEQPPDDEEPKDPRG